MEINEILNNLEKIGLSRKEGEIFLELVKNSNSNGSQIAKSLGYPRTTVYQNLDILEKRGFIKSYMNKEITYYEPVDLEEVLSEQKKKVSEAAAILKVELKKFDSFGMQKQFYNLNSIEDIEKKIKQMLLKAEKYVYINTSIDINIFKKEFTQLKKKGVRVILFNFHKLKYEKVDKYKETLFDELGIETYIRDAFNYKSNNKEHRIMIEVDEKIALIASNYEGRYNGIYSENKLLATIVKEHILNDINLSKLEEKYGKDSVEEIVFK